MNDATLLYRQIHPKRLRGCRVDSSAFRPGSNDGDGLSVDDGDKVTAKDSWKRYSARKLESAGVLAVTVEECSILERDVVPDPKKCNAAHALIDFSCLTKGQARNLGRELRDYAIKRDWLFRPDF